MTDAHTHRYHDHGKARPLEPVQASRVPLAMGKRVDVLVQMPPGGVLPVLALREGARERTRIVLAAAGAPSASST